MTKERREGRQLNYGKFFSRLRLLIENSHRLSIHRSFLKLHKHHKIVKTSRTNDKVFLEKIIKQARCIELLLYRDASTYEEYMDRSTFSARFVRVIKENKRCEIDENIVDLSKRFTQIAIKV